MLLFERFRVLRGALHHHAPRHAPRPALEQRPPARSRIRIAANHALGLLGRLLAPTANMMKSVARRSLVRVGYGVYRMSAEERSAIQRSSRRSPKAIFGADLSRLRELRARYAEVTLPIAHHSAWGGKRGSEAHLGIGWGGVDLRTFRGHNAYVWSYGCFWS